MIALPAILSFSMIGTILATSARLSPEKSSSSMNSSGSSAMAFASSSRGFRTKILL